MSARPLPVWAQRTVYVAGGLLFAAGAFLSGWSLTLLAEQCGIPRPFSLSLPLALDAGAAVGVALWVAGWGELQRAGRETARLLFALSVAGNAVERITAYQQLPDSWLPRPLLALVAVGVGVVFPLLAYRMAHLVLLVRSAVDTAPQVVRVPRTTRPAAAVKALPLAERKRNSEPAPITPTPAHSLDDPEVPGETPEDRRRRLDRNRKRRKAAEATPRNEQTQRPVALVKEA